MQCIALLRGWRVQVVVSIATCCIDLLCDGTVYCVNIYIIHLYCTFLGHYDMVFMIFSSPEPLAHGELL